MTGQDVITLLMVMMVTMVFIVTWAINRISILRIRKKSDQTKEISAIMQRTLDIGHNNVLKLDLRRRFAKNLHGDLIPKEGMSYEESINLIHPDDRSVYLEFIYDLYHGIKKTNECLLRWDISGEEASGEWRYMRIKGVAEYRNSKQKESDTLFCTITDETAIQLEEQKDNEMTDKYRTMFEQSIIGLAFYDKDGNLLTANRKMREILKFQTEKDPYYYSHSIYDLPTFRNILDNRNVEDLYFCTKSIVIERGVNCYTELRVHPIYEENGELYYISFSIRDVTQERELYLQNKKNDMQIREANIEIQNYENQLQYLMDTCNLRFFRCNRNDRTCTFYKSISNVESKMTLEEVAEHFVDSPFRQGLYDYENYFSVQRTDLTYMHPLFHDGKDMQWNFIDSVPFFDENGEMLGTYGVVRNVDELIKKQEMLKQETERANDSGRLKSVFMANMTHEIRTPLNSIVGFSDILPMLSTQEEKKEIIRVIMNNCDMLLRLINDILAISSLDSGGIHIETSRVDFAKSFDDICESLRERVQQPGVEFIKENPYKTFETVIDNGRVQQVITNFVTNAVKYTHQGHIKVGYHYENNGLYVYCEDTGEGIPKEAQSKIFDRFVKLNDFIQGTGLGLSICKAIADGHNGKIGVKSEGKDKGSTFWIMIPCEVYKEES